MKNISEHELFAGIDFDINKMKSKSKVVISFTTHYYKAKFQSRFREFMVDARNQRHAGQQSELFPFNIKTSLNPYVLKEDLYKEASLFHLHTAPPHTLKTSISRV